MSASSPLAVILINYHGLQNTLECIQSIKSGKIVVVNLESDEGKEISKQYPHVDVVESKNLGFSATNNLGARYAIERYAPEYLLFLNNDTRMAPDAIDQLLKFAQERRGERNLYCPKIYFEKGYEFHGKDYRLNELGRVIWYAGGHFDQKNIYAWHRGVDEVDEGQFHMPIETSFATGCCVLMSRETFQKVGSWDTQYFLYMEDLDYSLRVKKQGGKVWYVPASKIWHKNAGSSDGSGSEMHQYYQTRNRLYFGFKYAGLRTKLALVKEGMKMIRSGLPIQREAVLDAVFGRYGKRREAPRT